MQKAIKKHEKTNIYIKKMNRNYKKEKNNPEKCLQFMNSII